MDEKIKYIFFVFLGIIFYLIFLKEHLIEGLLEYEYEKSTNNCGTNRGRCLGNDSETDGWTEDDKNSYKRKGIKNYGLDPNSCSDGSNNYYDKICFFNDDDTPEEARENGYDSISDKTITAALDCKNKCDSFQKCRSFSFYPDSGSENSRCCMYTSGYSGIYGETSDDGTYNCYTKPLCNNGNYYSFKQCQYPEDNSINLCGIDSNSDNTSIFTFINGNCTLSPDESLQNCESISDPDSDDYCYCGDSNTHLCKKNQCEDSGTCFNTQTIELSFPMCRYGLDTNASNVAVQDSDIINEVCSCGLINTNPNTYTSVEDFNENNIICNSSETEYKYCSFKKDNLNEPTDRCKTLQDCNSSGTLLIESCGYDDENGSKQICKYTDENGLKNIMYNENLSDNPCQRINNCDSSQMNRKLEDNEFCFCPIPGSTNTSSLCSSGKECNSSGCIIEEISCENNYTLNEETNKCHPPLCSYYSSLNSSAINASCICDTDTSQDNYVCNSGYYCLSQDNEHPGCRTEDYLKPLCQQYSRGNHDPLTEDCKCGINSQDEPNICSSGKYCINNRCRSCSGTNHIPDPSNPTKCISREDLNERNKLPFFQELILKILNLFN